MKDLDKEIKVWIKDVSEEELKIGETYTFCFQHTGFNDGRAHATTWFIVSETLQNVFGPDVIITGLKKFSLTIPPLGESEVVEIPFLLLAGSWSFDLLILMNGEVLRQIEFSHTA
jgi:hypothetical protein